MTGVSLARVKALSAFLAIVLTLSVATIESAHGEPKSKGKKSSASAGSKSKSRSGKTASRSSRSRSSKVSARNSKGKGKYYARGKGRRGGRSRWRSQVATSSHTVGVHNYLSQAWTQPLSPAEKSSASVEGGPAGAGSSTGVASPAAATLEPRTGIDPAAHSASPDATRPRVTGTPTLVTPDQPPANPLVAAYADSLASFGFSA